VAPEGEQEEGLASFIEGRRRLKEQELRKFRDAQKEMEARRPRLVARLRGSVDTFLRTMAAERNPGLVRIREAQWFKSWYHKPCAWLIDTEGSHEGEYSTSYDREIYLTPDGTIWDVRSGGPPTLIQLETLWEHTDDIESMLKTILIDQGIV
jgi:hypothetical protein